MIAALFAIGIQPVIGYAGAPGTPAEKALSEPTMEQTEKAPAAAAVTPADTIIRPANKAAIAAIEEFRIDYTASYAAFKAKASLELKATAAPNEYVYEVATTATGMARLIQSGTAVERSRFAMTAAGIQPVQYAYEDGSGKAEKASNIDFDWPQAVARSVHEGASAELELTPGLLDRLTADLQSILELRAGKTPSSQNIAYKNSVRQYDLKLLGEESITVPAGTFDAVKFYRQRPGSRRATLIWFASDAGYLPIRIEQLKDEKSTITMVATSISPVTG